MLSKADGEHRVRCGGCPTVMTWPGYTQLDKVRTALRLAGWSNAISSTYRCPGCMQKKIEATNAVRAKAAAAERMAPRLF